jgi:hypothetical protein
VKGKDMDSALYDWFLHQTSPKKVERKKSKKSSVPYRMGDMRGIAVQYSEVTAKIKIKFK